MKTIKRLETLNVTDVKKQKVAAYARVSHQDLLQSLSEQISYYSKVIQNNPSWEYVGVYFDNSVSGRNTKNRKEYLRLIDDCRKGKIDIILTKSISRFGRNTIELLEIIRELKKLNIGVQFEKENIDTLTTDGELLLTLLAAVSEEESKAIGSNVRWSVKKKFEQGLPHSPQPILGYRWIGDSYKIEESEADIVRKIYGLYLLGIKPTQISRIINDEGKRTRRGEKFSRLAIYRILSQETYTGKLILQKTFHVKEKGRSVKNTGEKTMYIVENAHEAIISQEIFNKVQEKLQLYKLISNLVINQNYLV